ncbi:hypothetical protein OG455_04830 [Kitasatospora sp. NBC_01287]|nr:hypothetical protein [Kitasatospora sp. NBC_01287]MCX4744851.1 hypothetical protein [Kitasatospora sp. NBC_01287]
MEVGGAAGAAGLGARLDQREPGRAQFPAPGGERADGELVVLGRVQP